MKNNFTTLLGLLTVVLSSCCGTRIATTIGPQIPLITDITKICLSIRIFYLALKRPSDFLLQGMVDRDKNMKNVRVVYSEDIRIKSNNYKPKIPYKSSTARQNPH